MAMQPGRVLGRASPRSLVKRLTPSIVLLLRPSLRSVFVHCHPVVSVSASVFPGPVSVSSVPWPSPPSWFATLLFCLPTHLPSLVLDRRHTSDAVLSAVCA